MKTPEKLQKYLQKQKCQFFGKKQFKNAQKQEQKGGIKSLKTREKGNLIAYGKINDYKRVKTNLF